MFNDIANDYITTENFIKEKEQIKKKQEEKKLEEKKQEKKKRNKCIIY